MYGKRDAVLVDAFITVEQADALVDWFAAGSPCAAFAHHLGPQSEQLASLGADVVQGDLLDIASVRAALSGVRRAYFTYPVKDGLLDATAVFASATKETRLELVVNVSNGNAGDPTAPSPRTRQHWLSENVFDWANVGAVHLRATIFFENIRRQRSSGI